MKKLFASVLVGAMMLMGTNAFAQLSVGGGYINSTETSTYTVGNTSTSSKADLNGFYVGGQYNIKLVKGLGVAPGLYFSGLFGKRTDNYYITTGEAKERLLNHKYDECDTEGGVLMFQEYSEADME